MVVQNDWTTDYEASMMFKASNDADGRIRYSIILIIHWYEFLSLVFHSEMVMKMNEFVIDL